MSGTWAWTHSTQIPSRKGAHLSVVEEILKQLDLVGWEGRDFFGVQMALEESLTNAIRHGNKLDPEKIVEIECKLGAERFWLRVEDQGEGFDPSKVPDCTAPENLCASGGRGFLLIQTYMDSVDYNDRGNCVTMQKSRTS